MFKSNSNMEEIPTFIFPQCLKSNFGGKGENAGSVNDKCHAGLSIHFIENWFDISNGERRLFKLLGNR